MERDRDWVFEMGQAFSDRGDWFTSRLLRLIATADLENTERLRLGFPDHIAAYERWKVGAGEFAIRGDSFTEDADNGTERSGV